MKFKKSKNFFETILKPGESDDKRQKFQKKGKWRKKIAFLGLKKAIVEQKLRRFVTKKSQDS